MERLYRYQNGSLVARGSAQDRLFLPLSPGRHRLVMVDSAGRSDAVTYRVEG